MEIIAHLRQVREEKAIRLEELAAYTRIRLSFLQAMEEGRFEELPEPIYVQGFIRHYGDAMGLDGAALAKTVTNICLTPQESNNENQVLHEKPSIYVPLAVPYVLLLAAASFGLFYILNPQRSVESSSQKKLSPVASEQKTESAPKTASLASSSKPKASVPVTSPTTKALSSVATTSSPTASPSAEASVPVTLPVPEVVPPVATAITPTPSPTAETTSPVEVTLEFQDKSWVRVKVDGKTEFEGELNKGDKKTWTAKQELTIRSGNAGAVLVSANKKQPTPLGNMGSVTQVTFTPETVNNTPETVNSQ
ncbi:MAG: helix-turn-helix domain-containing protein [Scytonema sp. RU_4_4]|nr:helix-turn-helix domain-containing protein [Scytonema sp. RU_4_4]NJR75681.1 helix-turn-helix domain-containing protein [Scytonema sp. CRU_2_7]